MAEFDVIAKELITTYPQHFVRFLLNSEDFEVVRAIETELRTVESRELDTLLLVEMNGEESLVQILIEYTVVRLGTLEGEQIISEQLWGLLPFALLMQPPANILP